MLNFLVFLWMSGLSTEQVVHNLCSCRGYQFLPSHHHNKYFLKQTNNFTISAVFSFCFVLFAASSYPSNYQGRNMTSKAFKAIKHVFNHSQHLGGLTSQFLHVKCWHSPCCMEDPALLLTKSLNQTRTNQSNFLQGVPSQTVLQTKQSKSRSP